MKISTQISTEIVLSPEELKEAVIAFVTSQTDIPENPTITVDYLDDDNDNLTAVVSIKGEAGGEQPKAAAPKAARGKKANAAPTANQGASEEAAQPNISANPENREEPTDNSADAPFDVDEPTQAGSAPVASTAAPKIFPDTTTSAAPSTAPIPDVAANAKSLFANLKPPANQ